MMLNDWNPTHDDFINLNPRLLWEGGDVWKVDRDGVPHRIITKYGDLLTVKVPANIPLKYKGKKARRAVIWCNACELVTGVEMHFTGGNVIVFEDPESTTFRAVNR